MIHMVNQAIRKGIGCYLIAFFMATCATYLYWLNQENLLNNAQVTAFTINDVVGGLLTVQQALTILFFVTLLLIWGVIWMVRMNDATKKTKPKES